MFYIQTQDGDLPYIYKWYASRKAARKAAVKFINEHPQDGSISVCNGFHRRLIGFYRNDGFITEETLSDDNDDKVDVTLHNFVAS